jgi:hypothetical protein
MREEGHAPTTTKPGFVVERDLVADMTIVY